MSGGAGGMARLAGHRGYRILWCASTASLTGEFMQLVVLSGIALDLAGRPSAWGGVLVVLAVPQALLMPAGGAVVDRFRPRHVLVAADLAVLAAVLWLGTRASPTLGDLYVFAALFGGASAFLLPAVNAIVPELLPAGQVQAGNALLTVSTTVAQTAGPALAVAAMEAGRPLAFAAMASFWAVAALLLLRLPDTDRAPQPRRGRWSEMAAGLRAVRADPVIGTLVLAAALFASGYAGAVYVGLPALARLGFGAGDGGVGLLFGANGAGLLLGALLAGSLGARRQGLLGGLAILGSGLLLAASGAAGSVWAAVPPVLASGLCWSVGQVMALTAVQMRSPAEVRGRVIGLLTMGFFGLYPLSYGLAGLAGDALGPRGVIVCGGGLMAAAGALALGRRSLREVTL